MASRKKQHRHHIAFGRVVILNSRITSMGNRVVTCRLSDGTTKTLLASEKYWLDAANQVSALAEEVETL